MYKHCSGCGTARGGGRVLGGGFYKDSKVAGKSFAFLPICRCNASYLKPNVVRFVPFSRSSTPIYDITHHRRDYHTRSHAPHAVASHRIIILLHSRLPQAHAMHCAMKRAARAQHQDGKMHHLRP